MWLRASWELSCGRFTAMSFFADTEAPKHFYLSDKAHALLEGARLTMVDEDLDAQYVKVFGRKCVIEETPEGRRPANIIGLAMLKRMGLQLHPDEPHFSFASPFTCFCSGAVQFPS